MQNCRHLVVDLGSSGRKRDYRCRKNNIIIATYYIGNWTCDECELPSPSCKYRL